MSIIGRNGAALWVGAKNKASRAGQASALVVLRAAKTLHLKITFGELDPKKTTKKAEGKAKATRRF